MAKKKAGIIACVAVFMILEAASLWFLTLNSDLHKSSMGEVGTQIMAMAWAPLDHMNSYIGLRSDNHRLSAENTQLFEQILRSHADTTGESTIWAMRGFNFEFLPAYIVSRSHNSRHNYIIIDRGWGDGVGSGDGIITTDGVIGVVQNSSLSFSYAIAFDNRDFSVSARIGSNGNVGNLTWDGRSNARGAVMTGIPVHVEFEKGDTVYTSGYSTVFPPDIPIGTVRDSKVMDGNSVSINIDLIEDLGRTRHVMVVHNHDREELEELVHE